MRVRLPITELKSLLQIAKDEYRNNLEEPRLLFRLSIAELEEIIDKAEEQYQHYGYEQYILFSIMDDHFRAEQMVCSPYCWVVLKVIDDYSHKNSKFLDDALAYAGIGS